MRGLLLVPALALGADASAGDGGEPERPEAVLRSRRVLATATPTLAGRIVVAGGLEDPASLRSARGDAEIVDPFHDAGKGRVLPPLPLAGKLVPGRAAHAAVALSGGRVLLVGGDLAGTVELFDPEIGPSGGFRTIGALPGGPRAQLTATLLEGGRVLVTGGWTASREATTAAAIVHVESSTLSAVSPLTEARTSHTATLLEDGRVLVVGGVGRATTELFDPRTRSFTPGPRLRHVRDDHRATRLRDGSVLVTGGQDDGGRSTRTAERFVPGKDTFVPAGDLAVARADHAQLVLDDGRVLVLGGEDDDGAGTDEVLAHVEAYEPARDRFVTLAPLDTPRDDHAAVLLRDGRVCVVGGQTTGDRPLRSIEYYRPRKP